MLREARELGKMLLSVHVKLFLMAMLFASLAGLAGGFAFLVLYRMHSLGHGVALWRTPKDWGLYREYWKVAPGKRWSRAPVVAAVLSFLTAGVFLVFSMFMD